MNRLFCAAIIISALAVLLPVAGALSGYVNSNVAVTKSAITLRPGSYTTLGYNVTPSSQGNVWGTQLVVLNYNQLFAQNITVTPQNSTSKDPPFSGKLIITVSPPAAPGQYTIILAATGDDPSTNNATVALTIRAPSTSTIPSSGGSSNASVTTASTSSVPATVATTSINYYSGGGTSGSTSYGLGTYTLLIISMVIIVIIGGILMAMMKPMPTKLIILGVVLILIGIAVWLYGDYHGGLMTYIWGGVGLIIVGTIVWLAGDAIAGAFIMK